MQIKTPNRLSISKLAQKEKKKKKKKSKKIFQCFFS